MPSYSLPDAPLDGPVELTNCDREPIHIPAAIQPYGGMVVVELSTGTIVSISENADQFLPLPIANRVGETAAEALPDMVELIEMTKSRVEGEHVRYRGIGSGDVVISAHRCDGYCLIEFERTDGRPAVNPADLLGRLFIDMEGKSVVQVYDTIVRLIRDFTGFDRVMLYQFHEDLHGSVVAEAKSDDMETFLGLHYPAGDIPAPARRLYELKWIRALSDINAEPVPMVPATTGNGARPINMSFASLRAISPIHVEYLRNMRVGGSMSISVMRGSRLWGLIACHHRTAKAIPPDVRDACELSASLLSTYLSSRHQQQVLERQVEVGDAIAEQMTVMTGHDDIVAGLTKTAPWMAKLLHADGLAYHSHDGKFQWGEVPGDGIFEAIIGGLSSRSQEQISHTDELRAWVPGADEGDGAIAGLLAVPLVRRESAWLLFFRVPYARTIDWAGDPSKSVTDENGRLTPRKSFAKFRASVTGKSRPWTEADREAARSLATAFRTMIAEQASRLRRANEELRMLNADLDAFAYAASHDLKEPLRGIYHYLYKLESARDATDETYAEGLTGMKRIVRRMSDLLDGLLRFSRAGRQDLNIETFDLEDVVAQAKDLAFGGQIPADVEITVVAPGTITGDYACTREIFANLLTNAVKYNVSDRKLIELGISDAATAPPGRFASTLPVVFVRDNGIGIAPDDQSQVFEIFRRLHDRDEYGGGSGAGLTIVRRMVERHGGSIVIRSSPGAGATFFFTLESAE